MDVTDRRGNHRVEEYDEMHRLKKVTSPEGMISQYSYDANGNRVLMIDPMGRRVSTAYDGLDHARSINIVNADASLPQGRNSWTLGYDPEGNVTEITERLMRGSQTISRSYGRTYDARNRLTSASDPLGRIVRYGYDAANNVTSFTDAANRQTGYSYDGMNRVDKATLSGGRIVDYEWTVDGLMSEVSYGNGMSRNYSYDNADRVTRILNTLSATESEEHEYGYDAKSYRMAVARCQRSNVKATAQEPGRVVTASSRDYSRILPREDNLFNEI